MEDHHDIEITSLFRLLSFWNLSPLCLCVSETFLHCFCMSLKPFPVMSACQWNLSPSCLHVSETFPHHLCMSVKSFPIISACQWNLSPLCLHVSETFPHHVCMSVKPSPIMSACQWSLPPSCLHVSETFPHHVCMSVKPFPRTIPLSRPLCLKPFLHISVSPNPSPKATLLVKTTSEKRFHFKSPCLWNPSPKTSVLFKTFSETFPFCVAVSANPLHPTFLRLLLKSSPFVSQCQQTPCTPLF